MDGERFAILSIETKKKHLDQSIYTMVINKIKKTIVGSRIVFNLMRGMIMM